MPKGDTHQKKYLKQKLIKYDLELANRNDGEFYAKFMSSLGGNRIKAKDIHGNEYQIIIRGSFYFGSKKENLNFPDADKNDYWLLVQPGISHNQYFLKHIYTSSDCKKLIERGELGIDTNQNNVFEINNDNTELDINDNWMDNI